MRKRETFTRRLLRTAEASLYLGVSDWKIRQLAQSGEIPFVQDESLGPWLFDRYDLDLYIERHKQSGKHGLQ
jgi:excisionase family DNA binding protein